MRIERNVPHDLFSRSAVQRINRFVANVIRAVANREPIALNFEGGSMRTPDGIFAAVRATIETGAFAGSHWFYPGEARAIANLFRGNVHRNYADALRTLAMNIEAAANDADEDHHSSKANKWSVH